MYFSCLQADRPLTGGLISGGGRTFIQGGLVTGCMCFCLPIDGPITGGEGLQVGGALISGRACNRMYFLFTSRWDYNWGACKWRGRGGLYPRGL